MNTNPKACCLYWSDAEPPVASRTRLTWACMNAHVSILGEQMNRNGDMIDEFVNEMDLKNVNEALAEGHVTWCARNQRSQRLTML